MPSITIRNIDDTAKGAIEAAAAAMFEEDFAGTSQVDRFPSSTHKLMPSRNRRVRVWPHEALPVARDVASR